MDMKRNKTKDKFFVFFVFTIVLTLCSFVSADINIKNYSIEDRYFGGDNIRGWINMSLTNEPYDTFISGFDNHITLLNFLNNNNLRDKVGISCSIANCSEKYDAQENLSSTLNLAEGTFMMVGFKIVDSEQIAEISKIFLNISTNAGTFCSENMQPPLKIDILDDGSFEWVANRSSSGVSGIDVVPCVEKIYGCYNSSNDVEIGSIPITNTDSYCEDIVVGPGGGIKLGADISCQEDANFTITLSSSLNAQPKQWPDMPYRENLGGIMPGYFNSPSESSRNMIVCIKASNDFSSEKCSINIQENGNQSCGESKSSSGTYSHDFSIYAQPIAYSVPENFNISSTNPTSGLNKKVYDYLTLKYNRNCSAGCIVPVKIISNQNQILTITGGQIKHKSGGIQRNPSFLYELIKTSPLISMNFTMLDISKSGITVPSIKGNYTLNLRIGNKSIPKQISISNIPNVDFVFPYEVIVSEDTKFFAYSNFSNNITSYKWDFGDGSSEQTTINNSIIHRYNLEKNYSMKVTASSSQGQISSVFEISVLALSKENILKKLNKNNADLLKIETELNKLPSWLKDYLSNKMGINDTKLQINQFIESLNLTTNLTDVISYLNSPSANIASLFGISESSSGVFIINQNIINLASLTSAGAGSMSSTDESAYKKAIYNWLGDNMNLLVEEDVYSLFYNDRTEPVGSYFKVKLSPKKEYLGKLFLGINKNSKEIIFKDKRNTKNESQVTIIILDGSSSSQEIEFFVTGRVDPADTPIYLSPEFSMLIFSSNSKCFIDGECDSSTGENADTCPADCKSKTGKIITSIIILLIVMFIVYIILQEWYKRKYEDFLFKSKDDLYNVINFISNGEKQAMSKSEIFWKLLGMNWSNEQIIFAYKKFHGQRTGMYEIPIFKIFEKRKVQIEVGKRQAIGNIGNIVPKPIIMPPQTKFMGSQKTNIQQNPSNNPNKKV